MSSVTIQNQRPYATFFKYFECIFVVTKKAYYDVYKLLYQGGSQYVGDYLTTITRGLRNLNRSQRDALENGDNPSTFDISLLYCLLQRVCGLAQDTSSIWHTPSTAEEIDSLEHTLYRLKQIRNDISHSLDTSFHMNKNDLDLRLSDLKDLCRHLITKAGERAHKTPEEIDNCICQMDDNLKEIIENPNTSGLTAQTFAVIGRQEMTSCHSLSPKRSSFVMPLIHSKGKTGRHEMSLKLFPLWRCDDGSFPKVIVLQGDTGTGKTSICRYLQDSWLSNDGNIDELQVFDLVIHVPCCDVYTRDLVEFLRGSLEKTMKLCIRDEIENFLKPLKILWLVDGYDEATLDAIHLLTKIMEQGNTSHLVFITTKPPYYQELLQRFSINEGLCSVSLSGLSDEGVANLLMKYFQEVNDDSDICETKLREFLFTVASLGDGPVTDIRVPLKLKLMLEVWETGKLIRSSTASLTHLYGSILEVQIERMTKKMQKETKHKKHEIKRRIREWVEVLSKISFEMTMSGKFVKINRMNEEKLRSKAESLNYPEDCLTIFLHAEESGNHGDTASYCFFHGSHQIFLSAQHILTLLQNGEDPESILKWFFRSPMDNYLYPLLVQILCSIPELSSLEQSAAGILVKLISKCNEFDGFQLVKEANYSLKVVEEVSKHIGCNWDLSHLNIKAAHSLLEYVTPTGINLQSIHESDTIDELYTFLESVSQKELFLELRLLYSNGVIIAKAYPSNRWLTSIYSPDSKCHLTRFNGALNAEELRFMEHMTMMKSLDLVVFSNDILDKIIDNIKYMRHLENVSFRFEISVIMVTRSLELPNRCELNVSLIKIDDLCIRETSRSLSKMSKAYHKVAVYDTSATTDSDLAEELMRENVHVHKYFRTFLFRYGYISINYGSFSHAESMFQFKKKLQETYLESYEDDLGIKRERLVYPSSISPTDVIYTDHSPDFKIRSMYL